MSTTPLPTGRPEDREISRDDFARMMDEGAEISRAVAASGASTRGAPTRPYPPRATPEILGRLGIPGGVRTREDGPSEPATAPEPPAAPSPLPDPADATRALLGRLADLLDERARQEDEGNPDKADLLWTLATEIRGAVEP